MQCAQDARLRAASGDGQTRLKQGALVVATENGRLRKVRLEMIDFQQYLLDAEIIANGLAGTVGYPAYEERISDIDSR